MTAQVVLAERCHYCSRWVSGSELIRMGTGGAQMCWQCHERHERESVVFSEHPPKECAECRAPFAVLGANEDGTVSMFVHWKDGTYQILCRSCSDAYERKRLDLYGDTVFGQQKKLKGAK